MVIKLLSYKTGTLIDTTKSTIENAAFLFARDEQAVKYLPSGEYDLTPQPSDALSHDINLLVGPEGNGVVRFKAKNNHKTTVGFVTEEGITPLEGGRQIRIEDSEDGYILAGVFEGDPRPRALAVIGWEPGRSPERR